MPYCTPWRLSPLLPTLRPHSSPFEVSSRVCWAHRRSSRCLFTSNRVSQSGRFNILFCGSDAFSAASLRAIVRAEDTWKSIHVLTPHVHNRSRRALRAAPVGGDSALKQIIDDAALQVDQVPPQGIDSYQLKAPFQTKHASNILITASFGHILPNSFLEHFDPYARLNVHPSILPRWRGAAPIQWTIARGDTSTGVSVQTLVEKGKGIDAGGILGSRSGMPVPSDATYESLLPALADAGGEVLVETLRRMRNSSVSPIVQDTAGVTRAPKITEKTARIRWEKQSAHELERLARGIGHQVGKEIQGIAVMRNIAETTQEPLWTTVYDEKVQLFDLAIGGSPPDPSAGAVPGSAMLDKRTDRIVIRCAADDVSKVATWLSAKEVRSAGRKRLPVVDWWNGLPKDARKERIISLR